MDISNIIVLLGGVSLFLFGMSLMGEALKRVAGSKLEIILYKLAGTPLKGVLLGTVVTAIIQSSSATSVMVVGFVNSGMMKVRQAIGIVLGAILGTSITGWILCLSDISGGSSGWVSLISTSTLTGLMAVVGIALYMFSKNPVRIHVGEILLGFAVLMFGMSSMSSAVSPLRENETFITLLTSFSNPLLGILVGLVFTSVIQSASAAVGILQALATIGAVRFDTALPIIMGIAIGASVPVLLSALGANVNGKRTAFIYLLIDTLGVIICTVIFYPLNALFHFSFMSMPMTTVSVAALNSLFRFITLLLLTPAIGLLEKIVCRLIPDSLSSEEDPLDIEALEERFLAHPTLAVEQSRIAVNSMAMKAQDNLVSSFELLYHYSDKGYQAVQQMEDLVDKYEDRLGTYLVQITSRELTPRQSADTSKYLHAIGDFERISDHSVNIANAARELSEKQVVFSSEAQEELRIICAAVGKITSLTMGAFIDNDLALAAKIEPLEQVIDNLCDEMKLRHISRLQNGSCTLVNGFIFNDLITNFERVADHCSNIAVAIIELEVNAFETHQYLSTVKELHSGAFDENFSEFSRLFHF